MGVTGVGRREKWGPEDSSELEEDREVLLEQRRGVIRFVLKAPLQQRRGDQGGVDRAGVPPCTQLLNERASGISAMAPAAGPASRGTKTSRDSEPHPKCSGCNVSVTPQHHSRRRGILTPSLRRGGD